MICVDSIAYPIFQKPWKIAAHFQGKILTNEAIKNFVEKKFLSSEKNRAESLANLS